MLSPILNVGIGQSMIFRFENHTAKSEIEALSAEVNALREYSPEAIRNVAD